MKIIYSAKRLTGDVTEKSIRHYRTVDIVEISEIQFLEIDHFRDMSKREQINSQCNKKIILINNKNLSHGLWHITKDDNSLALLNMTIP
jgi:hypothetical protein